MYQLLLGLRFDVGIGGGGGRWRGRPGGQVQGLRGGQGGVRQGQPQMRGGGGGLKGRGDPLGRLQQPGGDGR